MTSLTARSIKLAKNVIKPKLSSKHRDNLATNITRIFSTSTSSISRTSDSDLNYRTIPLTPLDLESAGKLVNTSISHFDIRNLLREETILSSFALEKVSSLQSGLSSTHHPIISVAQEIFQDSDTKLIDSLGGFTLLLLAKSLESVPSFTFNQEVWEKQKIFAECYEMIDKAMYIHHKSIINLPLESDDTRTLNILNNGNKLAVLGGDYLFSFGIIRLASLVRRANVFDFIGASIDEFCVNHFDNYQRDINNWILPKSGMTMETWEKYGGYCSAKLAAYSAQFITVMTNLSSIRFEQAAFNFGYNLKLKWNMEKDIQMFLEKDAKGLSPISAPIIKYIERDPGFINFIAALDWEKDETSNKIKKIILQTDVIDECQSLSKQYSDKCMKILQLFPDCPSQRVLESIAQETNLINSKL
ncbi:decaprenyl-diphosphate synthase subunit 2 [Tetranychus urticae]|uniref:decaprenyl-diphosphate synthase subunit 2 n=1 Tax=Tetranychus urticae TaxID=32264 RepID=UPI00077BB774|nr:decaprenyl-diphosphate synthase subunit 2 [Tetranychus urticae]